MKTKLLLLSLFSSTFLLAQEYGASTYSFMNEKPDTVSVTSEGFLGINKNSPKTITRLKVRSPEKSSWRKVEGVGLYGGGTLNGVVTGTDDSSSSGAINGTLGLNFYTNRILGNLFFSYNPRQTVEMRSLEDFAVSLINPNLNGHSLSLDLMFKVHPHWGLSTKFLIADNLWDLDSSTIDASPSVFKLGLYYKFLDFELLNNDVMILINAHYTNRSVSGDFNNEQVMIEGYRVSQRGYNGFELSGNIYVNALQMYVQYSINPQGDRDFLLPGFSGNQVVIGLNVSGQIFPLN